MSNISYDSSVLINFLKINRMDLVGKCSHTFYVTEHVQKEMIDHYPKERVRFEQAFNQGILRVANVETSKEWAIFAELSKHKLGAGECAAIAIASTRGYFLAIDDNQGIKKASSFVTQDCILRTQDLIILMIQEHLLDLNEADAMKEIWASQHRFKMKFNSFRELIPTGVYRE